MSQENQYMIVNPSGDICLVYRATGQLSNAPFPIMMRDEWGQFVSYAEKGSHNHGCVPANLNDSSELFTRIRISKEQYELIGHLAFYCYRYEKQRRRIVLRPGHRRIKIDKGTWGNPDTEEYRTEVSYPDDLELCGIAYGGRPIYWIRWDSEKSHTDFPELATQGCLHPLKYKPKKYYGSHNPN